MEELFSSIVDPLVMTHCVPKLGTHLLTATLVFALCLPASAAPDVAAGMVFYESGRTIARTSFNMAIVLRDGGSYEGLYYVSTGPGAPPPPLVLNLEDGSWDYHKIDEKTAEIRIRSASGSGPVSGTRRLQFSSDTTGDAVRTDFGSGGSSGGSFRLVPQAAKTPLTNCSNRTFVRPGSAAFTGFVIADAVRRAVLIRAVGPGLASFGVASVLKAPRILIRSADGDILANSVGWNDSLGLPTDGSIALQRTGVMVGAFALAAGSKDSATIVVLPEGPYVAEVASMDSTDMGEVLVEVYMLP